METDSRVCIGCLVRLMAVFASRILLFMGKPFCWCVFWNILNNVIMYVPTFLSLVQLSDDVDQMVIR